MEQGEERGFVETVYPKVNLKIGTDKNFKRQIVWLNVFGFVVLHLAAIYGLGLIWRAKILTNVFAMFVFYLSGMGVSVCAHRFCSHKAFKATFSARLLLIILQTISGQNCAYIWARDHRLHHKYSDTDADPHNSNRGFFFSHMGWLMSKKHPLIMEKGKTIDMSDLEADTLIMFQKKYYYLLYILFAIAIPVAIPVYFWNETFRNSIFIVYFVRYVTGLHATWLLNSAAHAYGNKPFDKEIRAVQNQFVTYVTLGEGWHNFHHTFPWDYTSSEWGSGLKGATVFIDCLAALGMAYDLKGTPYTIIEKTAKKKGDGTHPIFGKIKEIKPVIEEMPK